MARILEPEFHEGDIVRFIGTTNEGKHFSLEGELVATDYDAESPGRLYIAGFGGTPYVDSQQPIGHYQKYQFVMVKSKADARADRIATVLCDALAADSFFPTPSTLDRVAQKVVKAIDR